MSKEKLELTFPLLQASGYRITSESTKDYNCIAWAAGDQENWWCPYLFWPDDISRDFTIESCKAAFTTLGYVECVDGTLEIGYEKIAIYAAPDGEPRHAARQLASGRWTSKLGKWEDIEHELVGLTQSSYGDIALFMKRPTR